MKLRHTKIVTPEPFFEIEFGISNRMFYGVKDVLLKISNELGKHTYEEYVDEKCDYEGDLERIIVYRDEKTEDFLSRVLGYFSIDVKIPKDMNVVFCC
jgi:hypothetical protein